MVTHERGRPTQVLLYRYLTSLKIRGNQLCKTIKMVLSFDFFFCDIFAVKSRSSSLCQKTCHIADDVLHATRLHHVDRPVVDELQQK